MQKPSERLRRKIEKENLWIFILRCLVKSKKTGGEIRKELKERYKLSIGMVTSYRVLYLLERGGYVKIEKEKNKKYYVICEKGREELEKGKKILEDYLRILKEV